SADFIVGRSASGCNKPGYKAATHPVVVGTHEKPSQTGGVHINAMAPSLRLWVHQFPDQGP
ncbi:hypothetical protein, partial [Burkholderia gladioli]|uniref:hypothetical protein n=1 Tax=Burkholderia gladioli TaxID=28095 RepID=UPI001C5EE519